MAIRMVRKLSSAEVIETLTDLLIARGAPEHIRSDQGPEFAAEATKGCIEGIEAKTALHREGEPLETRLCGTLQRQAAR